MASKICLICESDVSSVKSPTTCSGKHVAEQCACTECWEAHLNTEVEEKDPYKVECMFCSSVIYRLDLKRLARKGTLNRYMDIQSMMLPISNSKAGMMARWKTPHIASAGIAAKPV